MLRVCIAPSECVPASCPLGLLIMHAFHNGAWTSKCCQHLHHMHCRALAEMDSSVQAAIPVLESCRQQCQAAEPQAMAAGGAASLVAQAGHGGSCHFVQQLQGLVAAVAATAAPSHSRYSCVAQDAGQPLHALWAWLEAATQQCVAASRAPAGAMQIVGQLQAAVATAGMLGLGRRLALSLALLLGHVKQTHAAEAQLVARATPVLPEQPADSLGAWQAGPPVSQQPAHESGAGWSRAEASRSTSMAGCHAQPDSSTGGAAGRLSWAASHAAEAVSRPETAWPQPVAMAAQQQQREAWQTGVGGAGCKPAAVSELHASVQPRPQHVFGHSSGEFMWQMCPLVLDEMGWCLRMNCVACYQPEMLQGRRCRHSQPLGRGMQFHGKLPLIFKATVCYSESMTSQHRPMQIPVAQ